MKKIKFSFIAIAVLISFGMAGGKFVEPPRSQPIPIKVSVCGGSYIGGQITYIAGKTKIWNGHKISVKPTGGMGGLFAGYDFCLDNGVILSIEGGLNWGKVEKKTKLPDALFANNFNVLNYSKLYNVKIKQTWEASVVVHVGKKFGDNLLYLLVGTTFTNLKIDSKSYRVKKNLYGWTAGSGFEKKINDKMSVRLEYRYNKYVAKKYGYHYMKYSSNNFNIGLKYSF